MKRILVWFRNDLRLHDQEALNAAMRKADEIIPYYCFDIRQFGTNAFGFPKMSAFRAKFLQESVKNLAQNIENIGGRLVVGYGRP
jgi:deoxyribodipyrimidine photo-lyase